MGLGVLFIMGRSFNMSMCYSMIFLYLGVWLVVNVMGHKSSLPPSGAYSEFHHTP
jgi:hypothetical protein